jgi:low affinity Fe/Cu permease
MKKRENLFEKFSDWATLVTGSSAAFIIASLTVLTWAVTVRFLNILKPGNW